MEDLSCDGVMVGAYGAGADAMGNGRKLGMERRAIARLYFGGEEFQRIMQDAKNSGNPLESESGKGIGNRERHRGIGKGIGESGIKMIGMPFGHIIIDISPNGIKCALIL